MVKIIHVKRRKNENNEYTNEYEVSEHEQNFLKYIKEGKLCRYDYDPQDVFEPCDVIARAKSKLGHFRYNTITNNCKHFVLWCKFKANKRPPAFISTISDIRCTGELPKKQLCC